MDLSPKVFRDVQFRQKPRGGYHPEDVDEFLEQAALASESVLDQLRQANERANRAEQSAAEASTADDSLKRVLVLAQRTADQAVKEAYEEAERLVADARAKAQAILADADERGRSGYQAAVNERRLTMESADAALQQAREQVEALQGWVDLHRAHLLGIMREAQSIIESAGLVSQPPVIVPVASNWLAQAAQTAQAPAVGDGPPAKDDPAALSHRPEDAGSWDPHYLDNLELPAAAEHPQHAQAGVPAAVGDDVGADGQRDQQEGPPQETAEVQPQHASADPTLAFDESALESFFSDQDLGDQRGLGRFRRRP